ncbi:MAG: DUF3563 family protein [Paracoccaceae bacterium]
MIVELKKFIRSLKPLTRAERENAYLCGAQDRVDLEYRQREIDRGLFQA